MPHVANNFFHLQTGTLGAQADAYGLKLDPGGLGPEFLMLGFPAPALTDLPR